MSESRNRMISELKAVVVPQLRANFYHRNAHFGSQYVLSFTAHLDRLKLPFLR